MTPLASCSHSLQIMPVARAMRAAAANQIMMLAVNPLSSVCTNVHRDQYCTTRIELLVILSFTHFYGRAAAELSFSDSVLRTFTRLLGAVSSFTHNSVPARDRTNHTPCEGADHAAILLVDCWYGWKDQDKKRPCRTSATTCVSITRG